MRPVIALCAALVAAATGATQARAEAGTPSAVPAKPSGRGLVYVTETERVTADAFGKEMTVSFRQRVYARADALRTERLDAGDGRGSDERSSEVTIVLLAERRMIRLDPKTKTYAEVGFDDLRRSVDAHLKLLEAQLNDKGSGLTRSQRSRLLGILGRRRVKATREVSDEKVEMLGRQCTKVVYKEDGVVRIEEWVAEGLPRSCDVTPLLEVTGEFSRELLAEKRRWTDFAARSVVYGRLAISPVRTTNVVLSVEERKLDDSLFAVPEGARRAEESPPPGTEPGAGGGGKPQAAEPGVE